MIRTVRDCACGIVPSNSTRATRIGQDQFSLCRASGGIIKEDVTVGDYSVSSYVVDVLCVHFCSVIPSDLSSSLPEGVEGILGVSEETCNPTCVPPIYKSILAAEHGSCASSRSASPNRQEGGHALLRVLRKDVGEDVLRCVRPRRGSGGFPPPSIVVLSLHRLLSAQGGNRVHVRPPGSSSQQRELHGSDGGREEEEE